MYGRKLGRVVTWPLRRKKLTIHSLRPMDQADRAHVKQSWSHMCEVAMEERNVAHSQGKKCKWMPSVSRATEPYTNYAQTH